MEGDLQNKVPEFKLEAQQAEGFLAFFNTQPQDVRAIRFFDHMDYFTAHGENATFIAKTYYHDMSALQQLGSGSDCLSSVAISKSMFEIIARNLLLERIDHTIELYEGSGSNWSLVRSGSPGNIGSFEDVLFANIAMQDSPVTVALVPNFKGDECTVRLGYLDLTQRVVGLSEFLDNSHFTNTESALVAIGCKECLLPTEIAKSTESKELLDALSRCGVMITERNNLDFRTLDLMQDLIRLVKGPIEPVRELVCRFELASSALASLLYYAELLSDKSNYGNFAVKKYNIGSFMKLDSAAMKALNVMESKTNANKNLSLFGLMNQTCTAGMGKRLLHMWLKQSLLDVTEINTRLDLVQAFVEDVEVRCDLRQYLKNISDVERLTQNIQRKRTYLHHVVKLYQSCIKMPYIKGVLERYDGTFYALINERYLKRLESWTDRQLEQVHCPR